MIDRARHVQESSFRMTWLRPHAAITAIACALLALLSSGCAVTQRMNINDLNRMTVDCANKDAQIRFLETQMTTSNDRFAAALGMNAVSETWAQMNGQKSQARSMLDREYDTVAKKLIWDLRTHCPDSRIAGTNVRR